MEFNGFISKESAQQFAATCNGRIEQYALNVKLPGQSGPMQLWRVIDDTIDERMEVVSVRMPYSLYERVRNAARNEGTYASDIVRCALDAYLTPPVRR